MGKIQKLDRKQIAKLVGDACKSEHFQKKYKTIHRDYEYCGSFSDEFGDYACDIEVYKDRVKFKVYFDFDFLQHFSVNRDEIDKKLGCYVKEDKPKGLVFTDEILQDNRIIFYESKEKINQALSKNRLALYLRLRKINHIDALTQTFLDRNNGKLQGIEFGQRVYKPNSIFYRQKVTNDSVILIWKDNVVILQIGHLHQYNNKLVVGILATAYKHIVNSKFTNRLRFDKKKTIIFQNVDNQLINNLNRPNKVLDIFDVKDNEGGEALLFD